MLLITGTYGCAERYLVLIPRDSAPLQVELTFQAHPKSERLWKTIADASGYRRSQTFPVLHVCKDLANKGVRGAWRKLPHGALQIFPGTRRVHLILNPGVALLIARKSKECGGYCHLARVAIERTDGAGNSDRSESTAAYLAAPAMNVLLLLGQPDGLWSLAVR